MEGLLLQLPSNTISLRYLTILKTTCAKSLTNKWKVTCFVILPSKWKIVCLFPWWISIKLFFTKMGQLVPRDWWCQQKQKIWKYLHMQCVKNNYHQGIQFCYSITSNGNDQLMSWEKINYCYHSSNWICPLWKFKTLKKKWKYELVFVLHLISIKYIWNPKKSSCAFSIMWSVNLQ